MTSIRDNLQIIGAKLNEFAVKYQRTEKNIHLLAVSKKHSTDAIVAAYDAGQIAFGENYVQELLEKTKQLEDYAIEWHFIGPLQSNKTKKIAEVTHWVHTIDRLKIAQRLNDQRPSQLPPLSVCIQVNINQEETKSGVAPDEVAALAKQISALPNLRLRGLMAIPEAQQDIHLQRKNFSQLKQLKLSLEEQGYPLDTLSMGMSNDMEAAIAEGATIVRIGTAIFGAREY